MPPQPQMQTAQGRQGSRRGAGTGHCMVLQAQTRHPPHAEASQRASQKQKSVVVPCMSTRRDANKWMQFCKHFRATLIDEQNAVPDYEKLWREAFTLPMPTNISSALRDVIFDNISDEKKHRANLMPLFDRICPRMAVSRKGLTSLRLLGSKSESLDPSEYGAVITSEGIYRPRRRRRR